VQTGTDAETNSVEPKKEESRTISVSTDGQQEIGDQINKDVPVKDEKKFYEEQEGKKFEDEYKKETTFPEPTPEDVTRTYSWKVNIEKLDLAMDSVAREFPKLKNRGWKLVKITIEAL
jgi:hypothetical protein